MRIRAPGEDDQTIDAARVRVLGVHPASPGAAAVALARQNRFSAGDVLSKRFVIIRFLGSGGMGEVYEAQDRLLQGAAIALKTITADLAASPEALERFEREVLLARQVTHPNVCPIYDICYHEDEEGVSCFLSMKLLAGETLAARVEREGLRPIGEALAIVTQVAGALQAAHRAGIIHRDIKPSNIMLEGSGAGVKAVVMDFGLARTYDSDITIISGAHVIGTPGYMAPELLKGHVASAASDLYSFGLVVNEIFGGKKPSAESPLQLAVALRAPGVPPFLAAVTAEWVGEDPKRRVRAFEQALKPLNLERGPGGAAQLSQPFWTRRRWLVAAAAATGCAAGGATVWEWDDIRSLLEPLPRRRHVALVNWPPNSESRFEPALLGVIDALERELSRAEAFDSDLYVVSALAMTKGTKGIPSAVGANLMLASSVEFQAKGIQLVLEILDAAATRLFRRRVVKCSVDELTALPEMAVRAAAKLLGISQFVQPGSRLKIGTNSPEAYKAFQEAEALRHQPNDEKLDGAIAKYKDAIEVDNRYALALTKLASAYFNLYWESHDTAGLDLAQANAATALGLDPTLSEAHQVLGYVSWARGNASAATEEFGKALKLDPSDPEILTSAAIVLADTNQTVRAEEMFLRALKARPNYSTAYCNFGNFLRLQGRYPEALRAFRAGHLTNPQNSYILSSLGQMAFKSGLLTEASESLKKSLALGPSAVASASLAQELRAEGKYTEALNMAQKAMALDSGDDEIWRELGDCYGALPGYREKARQAYAKAAENAENRLKTNNSEGPRWMLLALYQAKLQQLEAALTSMQKAEAAGAVDLDSQLIKIRILELAGKRSDALDTLTACFRRGATKFEMDAMPDLQSLRADHRYLTVFHSR